MKHLKHWLIASSILGLACGDDGGSTDSSTSGSDTGTDTTGGPGGTEEDSTGNNGTEEGTDTGSTGPSDSTGADSTTDTGDDTAGTESTESGSGSGSTGDAACGDIMTEEECNSSGCLWGPPADPNGECFTAEEGCGFIPVQFCDGVDQCMVDGENCVPAT